ncbi:hypothetical protein [Mycobacterium intracellulare]|uniref:hypothetical protein n=1 Tax=Mycobacterium intracellulare TaxID=1767 RepID=UPI002EC211DF|nr:hypothetical protein [Mycobacterium intracellulare]
MTNYHAEYSAKKKRVMEMLAEAGATSRDCAIAEADLTARFGEPATREAFDVAACGGEVKYSRAAGYWVGRTRNNGRS